MHRQTQRKRGVSGVRHATHRILIRHVTDGSSQPSAKEDERYRIQTSALHTVDVELDEASESSA